MHRLRRPLRRHRQAPTGGRPGSPRVEPRRRSSSGSSCSSSVSGTCSTRRSGSRCRGSAGATLADHPDRHRRRDPVSIGPPTDLMAADRRSDCGDARPRRLAAPRRGPLRGGPARSATDVAARPRALADDAGAALPGASASPVPAERRAAFRASHFAPTRRCGSRSRSWRREAPRRAAASATRR